MQNERDEVVYQIDQDDLLVYFNDQWDLFANANNGLGVSSQRIYKKSIWDFIHDAETRHLHETLLKRVRSHKAILHLPFRCDAPDLRRYMEMSISLLPHRNVEYRCRTIKTESREAVAISAAGIMRDGPFLRMCSWCKKIDVGNDTWLEIEDAIKFLGFFSGASLPQISHTMCDSCMGDLGKEDDK